ncbi:MAG: Na+/H+ antiporter NhaA [Thermodesulfobacteriota bacterium]
MSSDICPDSRKSRWERAFIKVRSPFEEFVHDEATGGLLLMGCAFLAMILANSPLAPWYEDLLHTYLTLSLGDFTLRYTVHHWINDGLMGLFFFVVGLEIKREILVGELADFRQAILPVAAALGGMVAPALVYFILNRQGPGLNGWAIPMATDIAFAMGTLVLLGPRAPKALLGFLLALAIVDDLGAVLVIALFYTAQINWPALLAAGVCLLLLIISNVVGLRRPLPYLVFGTALWLAMLKSGIHATLAGVITALTVPANSPCSTTMFVKQARELLGQFTASEERDRQIMENSQQQAILQGMETTVKLTESPLQRLEHHLHLWVSFLIVPLFALANAGIKIDLGGLAATLGHPVTLGVIMGLVLGKPLGICGAVWLVTKMFKVAMPPGMGPSQVLGVSLLAGIGFTMSIFIGGLAFAGEPQLLLNAKIGVVIASLLAGLTGGAILFVAGSPRPPTASR